MTARPDARERAVAAFEDHFGCAPAVAARAPGRVNLIGEHVDYNDGLVLPVAIDRFAYVAASPRDDSAVQVVAIDLDGTDRFRHRDTVREGPGWHNYVRGVAAVLDEAGYTLPGANLVIASDVPIARGLSSSAALELAVALAFLDLADASVDPRELARLCRRAEAEWAGVQCGIMDQVAAACSVENHALFLDCRDLRYNHVPIPPGVAIVVSDSRAPRSLASSAYNRRRRECEEAASMLGVASLREVTPEAFAEREAELPEPHRRRARHVVTEIARAAEAAACLLAGELRAAGEAMNGSHESLRTDYEVSSPQLDALVCAAREVRGTYGSRLTGAGFGGCTVSLVAADDVPEFLTHVPPRYRELTNGRETTVWVCRAAAGATVCGGAG